MLKLDQHAKKNITLSPDKRASVMITHKVNTKLKTLADYYELPKKYVIKMLIEEKIAALHQCNKEVAN
ncbi:hypothetical protein [Candidatus Nitrosocosmicus sp. SS]|jgi:hypothetical protein|uniref:hypothetical protein n=1 Tax=Candidatus Nitrosocosmicus agrestis TaxID=2563600 RepID=UPI00122DDAD2|nr:hypothetical protein [Candidatus Nitrosocosmicus sp. SS]KAA2282176.1 hypothetical protein F1Z66_07025 [Candidatus Nitrosocosmicus sp. SS]KAF0869978.1 hypothetical protein E5N71_01785 [Candidatus Nitrosocosmicus sp. SS]